MLVLLVVAIVRGVMAGAPGTPAAPGPGGSAVSLLPMECSDPGLVALLRPALYTTL